MAKVVLENLVRIYPEKNGPGVRAVSDINLTIEDREFMVLVGPSGCGKSTTLRMVAGLEEITSGTVTINGRVVNGVPPKDRDIAMVFQNYALYPHMSVYDNLAFGLTMRKLPRAEIDVRVREAAVLLGLDACLQRRPKELSGGQRQRVAVGRAIVRRPEVFLFDEPLSNLDAKMRVSMRTEISKLHARVNSTMIYVTHDQVEAMTMGDRICVMKEGNIMQVAGPLELYHQPANMFVAGFIGSPPMNFFPGTVRPASDHVVFVSEAASSAPLRIQLPAPLAARAAAQAGKPLFLGVRPEDIHRVAEIPNAWPGSTLDAQVELAEPMGAETYLYLRHPAGAFIARTRAAAKFEFGQPVTVALDPAKLHLFDAATGSVLA